MSNKITKSNREPLNKKSIMKKKSWILTLKMIISKKCLKKVKRMKMMRRKKKNKKSSKRIIFLTGKFIPGIKTWQKMTSRLSMDFFIFKTKTNEINFCWKRLTTSTYMWLITNLSMIQKMTMKQSEIFSTIPESSPQSKNNSVERANWSVSLVRKRDPRQIYLFLLQKIPEFIVPSQTKIQIHISEKMINHRFWM